MIVKKKKYHKTILFTGMLFLVPFFLFAQPVKKSRILFLLDASSSMTYNWNPKYSRFEIASNILLKIIDSVYALNNEVEFAVRAYGTQFPAQDKNCTDTRLEVPFNIQNVAQINTRLKNLTPIGFSPIAYSLRQASENELSDARLYDYSIIFITDGGESCNGNVCNTFKEFIEKKIKVKPYIIGLDKNEQLNLLYECMGNFIKVSDSSDIDKAVKMIVDANRPLLEKPKLLNLPTVFANPPLIKDTGEVEVKPAPIKVVKSTHFFPRIKMIPYRLKVKDQFVLKPAYIIQQKLPSLTIDLNEEEVLPKVVAVRKTDIFRKMSITPYSIKPTEKVGMKGVTVLNNKPKPATLRFDIEEPPVPVVRNNDLFPTLKAAKYKQAQTISKVKLNAQPMAFENKKAATLRFEVEVPIVRKSDLMPRMRMKAYPYKSTFALGMKSAKPANTNNKQTATLRFEVEEKKKLALRTLRADKYPMRYSYAYRLPKLDPRKPNTDKAILRFSSSELGIVEKKKDTVAKKEIAKTPVKSETEFSIDLENSNETKVQIYFVGRNGKTYPAATPEIVFKDINTKSMVTSFRRQVEGGEPVAQNIAPGLYNVIVTGYNDLYLNNVTITPNKLNKVTIKVSDGTLSFAYVGNRTRTVEYKAIVNRRFAAGATVLQKCADKLPYDPGTYYVEINTLPASKFSIDMSFGALYELQIPEPGTLQIVNSDPIGNVQLQYEHGDKFEVFYTMKLTGAANEQTIDLQPGRYKIIFPADPKLPQMGTKILEFRIKSNETTSLQLQ
jgi:hypothetical protein